jgi:diguanylate cyclase (GGDEF)-like protein
VKKVKQMPVAGDAHERRIARLQIELRESTARYRDLEKSWRQLRERVSNFEIKKSEQEILTTRLSKANADAAELMAELEMKNEAMRETNIELARANANAAELVAAIEMKDEEITKLNKSMSRANALAAQLVAEREIRMEEMAKLNRQLKVEIAERKKAEKDLQKLTTDLKSANENLDRLATIDTLTELYNRRGLQRHLDVELNRVQRTGATIGVVFGDVDDFKRFNEDYGHVTGDAVLQEVAKRFKGSLRASDFLGRVGGDEFLAVLPGVSQDGLKIVAERIRSEVAGQPLVVEPIKINGSVSLGASILPKKISTIKDIMALCKSALKASKHGGKNMVTIEG